MTEYSNIDSLLEDHPLPWTSKYVRFEGTCFYDKNGKYVGTLESITPDLGDILPQLLEFYAAHRNKAATKEDQINFLKADIGTLRSLIKQADKDDIIGKMSLTSRLEQVEKELEALTRIKK